MDLLAFLLGCVFIVCLVLLFRKAHRRKGLIGAGVSLAALLILSFPMAERDARDKGFASLSDLVAADKAGFKTAEQWNAHKATIDLAAAEAAATAEAAAQAALAEQQAAEATKAAQLAAEQKAAQDQAAADAEHDRKYGFRCLDFWDGSHPGIVRAVKAALNDPDSFEHDETKVYPVNAEGRNAVFMTFRARNGFGGVVRGKATGSFDNASCEDAKAEVLDQP